MKVFSVKVSSYLAGSSFLLSHLILIIIPWNCFDKYYIFSLLRRWGHREMLTWPRLPNSQVVETGQELVSEANEMLFFAILGFLHTCLPAETAKLARVHLQDYLTPFCRVDGQCNVNCQIMCNYYYYSFCNAVPFMPLSGEQLHLRNTLRLASVDHLILNLRWILAFLMVLKILTCMGVQNSTLSYFSLLLKITRNYLKKF